MFVGRLLISNFFEKDLFLHGDKLIADKYLQLLQKFEVALCVGENEVIIPSLMPKNKNYPKPNDNLKDVDLSIAHDSCYQPPLRRIWFTNYIPDGFWPRLICRLLNDQQIKSVLGYYFEPRSDGHTHLDWICWRSGLVFASRGRTLLLVRNLINPDTNLITDEGHKLKTISMKYRIEVHIYISEMINTLQELISLEKYCPIEDEGEEEMPTPFKVAGHATRLMVTISNHIAFLSSWFHGMFQSNSSGYIPCWKCYGGVAGTGTIGGTDLLIDVDGAPCCCLTFSSCIIPYCHDNDVQCPVHGDLKVVQSAPDLVSLIPILQCSSYPHSHTSSYPRSHTSSYPHSHTSSCPRSHTSSYK